MLRVIKSRLVLRESQSVDEVRGADLQVGVLLHRLAADEEDALRPVWTAISDTYTEGDCCKALRMLGAVLRAQQDGQRSRRDRKFPMACPYEAPTEAPIKASEFLHIAWVNGWSQEDAAARCRQAEGKVYDAYKELTELRDLTERLEVTLGRNRIAKDVSDYEATQYVSAQQSAQRLATRTRNLHGTILTSAVKHRLAEESRRDQELLGLDGENEKPPPRNSDLW